VNDTKHLQWRKGKKGTRYGYIGVPPNKPWEVPKIRRWCVIHRHPTNKKYVLAFLDSKPPMLFDTRGHAKQMALVIYELEK